MRTLLAQLRARLQKIASPSDAKMAQRFFKTAPGEYGAGDKFIGIRVPVLRKLVGEFRALPLREVTALLHSPIHEERLLALLILVDGYARAPFWFAVMAVVLGVLLMASTKIASRTSNLMSSIWRKTSGAPSGRPNNWIYGLRSSKVYIAFHEGLKHRVAPAFFAALFVYLGLSALSHVSYNVLDVWGQTCIDNQKDSSVPRAT